MSSGYSSRKNVVIKSNAQEVGLEVLMGECSYECAIGQVISKVASGVKRILLFLSLPLIYFNYNLRNVVCKIHA